MVTKQKKVYFFLTLMFVCSIIYIYIYILIGFPSGAEVKTWIVSLGQEGPME